MLDAIYNLLNRANSLHNDFAVDAMDKPQTMDLVVELNTQEQLFEQGIDSRGISLEEIGGDYATVTKRYKAERGQRFDHVTLNDTGEFYRSFDAVFDATGNIIITANSIKDGKDIALRWGEDTLGLTPQSIAIIKPINRDNIIKELRNFL